MCERRKPASLVGLAFGLMIVLVGVVFTLVQFGIIPYETAILSWPLVFVVIGLVKLLQPSGTLPDRLFGAGLITAGALLEAHQLDYIDLSWTLIWPLLVIFVGLHVLAGALFRRRLEKARTTADGLHEHVVFGERESRYDGDDFQGGSVSATFGSAELDLSQADFPGNEVALDVRALFGGVEIRVPRTWNVVLKGVPIMGAYEDKTRSVGEGSSAKRLVVTGQALFGGVEIKN